MFIALRTFINQTLSCRVLHILFICVVLVLQPMEEGVAAPGDAIVTGVLRVDPSNKHIGILWWVEGDDNLDSSMTLDYRVFGTSDWLPGSPAMRAYPTIYVQDGPLGLNYWAASALFLQPGVTYELRVTIADPDGGGQSRIITSSLLPLLEPDLNGRALFVVPGNGGGDGTESNPFLGLQAAADASQPGDTFSVGSGTYLPWDGSRDRYLG
jgi:hypothetical protein